MFASVKSLVVLFCLAASALSQNIAIALPAGGASVTPGSNVTVQVTRPDSLTGSTEVGLAVCLKPCGDSSCEDIDVSEALGDVLYTGLYDPEYQSGNWYPFQNFTVTIPSDMASGNAILSVTQLALVGAGPYPYMEVVNTTVTIA